MKKSRLVTSLGLFALSLFTPIPSNAAACPTLVSGNLFKVPKSSAVYQVNDRGERMYFPNSEVFFTWYTDFKSVQEIPATCMEDYPLAGGINYRPGSRLVKTYYSNNIYAISPGNTRHKITTADIARELHGPRWESIVRVIPEYFMLNLSTGMPITSTIPYNGQLLKTTGSSTVYLVKNNQLRPLLNQDSVIKNDIREVSPTILQTIPTTPHTSVADSARFDPGQKTTNINWQVRAYRSAFETLDFLNGVGVDKPPAVKAIAGTPDELYTFYRADQPGHTDWNVKQASSNEDLLDFLNATGAYSARKPVEEALFVDRDRLYVFYRGENSLAKWARAQTKNMDETFNFINGRNGYTVPRVGTINGPDEKNLTMFYRLDKTGADHWGWKLAPNMTDARNFIGGQEDYDKPIVDLHVITNDRSFYIFYHH